MEEQVFLEKMQDLMDTDVEITLDTVLDSIEEWDSLSHVAFMALSASLVKKRVQPADIKAAVTIGDLYRLLQEGSKCSDQ